MPPIRDHQQSASPELQQNSEGDSSPTSEKSASMLLVDKDRNKRVNKRSPSINTRASRVGVTNFINVIKSLHPGESINYFPITKETLQEYIDSKRKALIKAGSLEQYLQHIQAYNIALGFGWDGHVFGPIIKKALDELRNYEEETSLKTGNILVVSSGQPQQPTLVNSVISQQLQQSQPSNPFSSSMDSNFNSSTDVTKMENAIDLYTIDEDDRFDPMNEDDELSFDGKKDLYIHVFFFFSFTQSINQIFILEQDKISKKVIYVVCFDTTTIPFVTMEQRAKVYLDNLNSPDPL